jgi:hypothetical protein
MKKPLLFLIFSLSIGLIAFAFVPRQGSEGYIPPKGFIPDAQTAEKIAEAVWIPIYGKDRVDSKKPFTSKLSNNSVWIVQGTVKTEKGGAPYIEIQKNDGKILKVLHGK